MARWI